MAEQVNIDRITAADRMADFDGIIDNHIAAADKAGEAKTQITDAVNQGGLLSKQVMAVVGTLQRQGSTKPGLYKALVTLNNEILNPQATPPPPMPEPVTPNKEKPVTAATKPENNKPAKVPKTPAKPKTPKVPGNPYRGGSHGFYIHEAVRDGTARTFAEVAAMIKTTHDKEIKEGNYKACLRGIKLGTCNSPGFTFTLVEVEKDKVKVVEEHPAVEQQPTA